MSIMNYEHEWARNAREAVCREPLLDCYELNLFDFHVRATQNLINQMTSEARHVTHQQLETEDECAGDGWIPVDYFVRRIRYGQVIYLVSLVETFLTKACERLEVAVGERNITFRLDELSGEKLTRRKKFLERYGSFSIPGWETIEVMVRIRNTVVHENGEVRSGANNSSPSLPGLTIDEGQLVLGESFICLCSTAVRALIDHVETSLREVADRSLAPRPIPGA